MDNRSSDHDEIKSFIAVWITAVASLTYCYFLSSKLPKGFLRLFSLLPIITLFTLLPLNLSSIQLSGTTGFFIAWLANFKLLLFAFGLGPLSSHPPHHLPHFISLACLPIKAKQSVLQYKSAKLSIPDHEIHPSPQPKNPSSLPSSSILKLLLLALLIRVYDYKQHFHPKLLLCFYCLHIYFQLEIILSISAYLARSLLGIELEPQFDKPYLSTSLQDFWGKRWNLMVTKILRPTIYDPVRRFSSPVLGKSGAFVAAVLATFAVSGVMHELMFFYLSRERPTWEVMSFFGLHGVCLLVEVAAKKAANGREWQLHPVVAVPLTVGFVMVTAFWLFFPQMLRGGVDVKAIEEYAEVVGYATGTIGSVAARIGAPVHNVVG